MKKWKKKNLSTIGKSIMGLSKDFMIFYPRPVLACGYCHRLQRWKIAWLTHWGRVTHVWVSKLTIIGSDNGLTGAKPLSEPMLEYCYLIGPLGTNFSEILIEILTFSFKKMRLKVLSVKRQPFCLGLNVLRSLSVLVSIDFDLEGQIWFNKTSFLVSPLLEIHNRNITTTEPTLHTESLLEAAYYSWGVCPWP